MFIKMDKNKNTNKWVKIIQLMLLSGMMFFLVSIFLNMSGISTTLLYKICEVAGMLLIYVSIIGVLITAYKRDYLNINGTQLKYYIFFISFFLLANMLHLVGNQTIKNVALLISGILFCTGGIFFYRVFYKS